MSDLVPARVAGLRRGSFGDPYIYAAETASTQDALRAPGLPEGAVALAEHQTAGRGRSNRAWDDTPGTALLFSLLLRPPPAAPLQQLSLVAGLATAEAVERETGLPALVKWPNDVLVDGRKLAGILCEASGGAVVCGLGINVNQTADELPALTRAPATSLRIASGTVHDRAAVLVAVLERLEQRYAEWRADGLPALLPELGRRNALRGHRVRTGRRTGEAGEIAPDGRLVVTLDRGDVVFVESGEVELVPPPPDNRV